MAICCILLAFLTICFLSGCADKGKGIKFDKSKTAFSEFGPVDEPSEELENEVDLSQEAMDHFVKGHYTLAEETFQKIRDRYPFSPYVTLAELRLADCKFYTGNYQEAIALYEEFEKLHPTNDAIEYVIFQEGTCYYKLMKGPDRDQTFTHKLIEVYERLLKRYPDSPYSYEARRRIAEARNRLARHELTVARWYIRTGQISQAVNRLEIAMNNYSDTPAGIKAARILEKRKGSSSASDSGIEVDRSEKSQGSWWRTLIPFI